MSGRYDIKTVIVEYGLILLNLRFFVTASKRHRLMHLS